MDHFTSFNETLNTLRSELERQYYDTNIHIMNNENAYIKPDGLGGYRMSHAKYAIVEDTTPLPDLFPRNECISLSEILSTVEKPTKFLKEFEHWQPKSSKPKPANRVFYAGIIGNGCQIGTQKIAKISKKINATTLESTVNRYFSIDNLQKASDRIVEFVDKIGASVCVSRRQRNNAYFQ